MTPRDMYIVLQLESGRTIKKVAQEVNLCPARISSIKRRESPPPYSRRKKWID